MDETPRANQLYGAILLRLMKVGMIVTFLGLLLAIIESPKITSQDQLLFWVLVGVPVAVEALANDKRIIGLVHLVLVGVLVILVIKVGASPGILLLAFGYFLLLIPYEIYSFLVQFSLACFGYEVKPLK